MSLARWDPFADLTSLNDEMNRLFRGIRRHQQYSPEEFLAASGFAPPVDIYEDDHNITLKIEVPGIEEKDIDIRVENNVLTVRGVREFEREEREENFRRVERQYGSFTRSFTLPATADPNLIQANYEKGVLKITVAKRADAKPKQIKVNVGGERTLEGKEAKGTSKAA
jgi:HSP20 family protein